MKPTDKDLAIASLTSIAYLAAFTYAILSDSGFMILVCNAVFATWLFACWKIDQAEKRRLRQKQRVDKLLAESLAELEQWREMKEAD